jgi:hypothetical protein
MKIFIQTALDRHKRALGLAVLIGSLTLSAKPAQAQLATPNCTALGAWAVKFDRNSMWKPNAIGNRNEIPSWLASEETATLFKKPMVAWTESEAKSVRDAILACRKNTKDKAVSGAYNAIQSALINRVVNFAAAVAQARPKVASTAAALKTQPASISLLRFQAALAEAVTLEGYNQAQRAANGLSGSTAAAGRDLLAAMRELPQAEIVETIAKPAAAAAQAMRADVVQSLVADVKKIPATGDGLMTLDQMAQALPREYGPALGDALKTVQQAVTERRTGVTEEITTVLLKQIGESSQDMSNAFADIDQRANEAFLPKLMPAQASKVRDAATARRQAVADVLFKEWQKGLSDLKENDSSLKQVDMALGAINTWPASAASFKPRFQEAAQARRATILAAVNKAESGSMKGRIYESRAGHKLEFVDGSRIFFGQGGGTSAGTYTEEKDGRVVLTLGQQSTVWRREGRELVGPGDMALTRSK